MQTSTHHNFKSTRALNTNDPPIERAHRDLSNGIWS